MTSFNESSRSDLRLYESDNNATMIALANQGDGFLSTCATLLQRMIETVPKNVVLSDVVSPMDVKPVNVTLDFDAGGNLTLSGYIRVRPQLTHCSRSDNLDSYSRGISRPAISRTQHRPLFHAIDTRP